MGYRRRLPPPVGHTGKRVVLCFVSDVEPYEMMKLRMLNGTHSLIAYAGYLAGFRCVRDAMQSDDLRSWVRAHLAAAARTLNPVAGIDYVEYANSLEARFANRAIAHETYQIAMDATEKLPQRIFAPALHALQHQQPLDTFALATAAWIRYCRGVDEAGSALICCKIQEKSRYQKLCMICL